jgi:outer membrane autotransporter protein
MHKSSSPNSGISHSTLTKKQPYTVKTVSNSPGQLSLLALSLAAALSVLAAPRAWALDTPSSQSSYIWDSTTDVDVSIINGVVIGGSSSSTGLSANSNNTGLGTLTNQGLISGTISGLTFGSGGSATLIDNGTLGNIIGGVNLYSTLTTLNNSGNIAATTASAIVVSVVNVDTITNSGVIEGFNGIYNYGTVGTLNNSGQINGTMSGIYAYAGSEIDLLTNSGTMSGGSDGITNRGSIGTLNNSGLLSGGRNGFNNYGGSISALSNTGTITGTGTSYGIANDNSGVIGAIDNLGTLATISGSIAITNNSGATINTLTNSGTIIGSISGVANAGNIGSLSNTGSIGGTFNGVTNSGVITTLDNTGTLANITGQKGINNASGGTISTLTNSGTISGSVTGLINVGSIGSLSNSGVIHGNSQAGIISSGTIDVLSNTGSISGGNDGIYNTGSISTLSNLGSLASIGGHTAIYNGSIASIATLTNSGSLSGSGLGIRNYGSIGTVDNSGVISGVSQVGISNMGSIGFLNNTGMIDMIDNEGVLGGSSASGVIVDNSGTIGTFNTSGTITGALYGVRNTGSIGTLYNSGQISGSSTAIANSGTIGTLTNTAIATISGNRGIYNSGTITVLENDSVIHATIVGITNNGTISTLTNTGTIIGGNGGGIVNNSNSSITTLSNTGIINNNAFGISNAGSIVALNNSGTINSSTSTAISNTGHIGTLTNSGLISGIVSIWNDGTIDTLTNSGLLSGSLYAIDIASNGSIGNFVNSGTVAGNILNESANALTISGGSASVFGVLTGVNGSIGKLYSVADVTFRSGNLLLNDDIGLGISFNSGTIASISGLGTVTNSGAVLQVNNHITITGNYQQNAAATLLIGVADGASSNGVSADTGYGRLIVTGNATVDSGSGITLKKLNTYSFATGQRFVVIQASTATYNAGTLVYTVDGYNASGATVTEGSNQDLVVTIGSAIGSTSGGNGTTGSSTTTSSTLSNAATDSSATGVFKGLFNYSGVNQSMLNVFNPALTLTDPTAANQAGQRLSPTATRTGAANGTQAAANAVGRAANDRLDTQRGGGGGDSGVATGESTLSPALWGRAFGGRANQGTRDGIAGFHANYGGVLIGGDALVNPDWRVGGLFSYARTNVGNDGSNSGSSASVNSYGLTAYAGFDGKPWYVNLTAGVSRQQYSSTRDASFTNFSGIASGSYNGSIYTASAQAGYPLDIGPGTLTPLAGLKYSSLRQNGYTESGGNGAALTVNGNTSSSLKSEIGVKAEHSFLTSYGMLKPSVQLGWNHEFRDTRQTTSASFAADTSGSTAFTTQGATPLRDTAQLSLGVALLQSKNLTVSARYTVEGASGYTAQTGDLTLRWQY